MFVGYIMKYHSTSVIISLTLYLYVYQLTWMIIIGAHVVWSEGIDSAVHKEIPIKSCTDLAHTKVLYLLHSRSKKAKMACHYKALELHCFPSHLDVSICGLIPPILSVSYLVHFKIVRVYMQFRRPFQNGKWFSVA